METKEVVIERVGATHVEYGGVSNPKEHFPNVKVGQTWRVTTAFSAFYRGVVVTKAVLIKEPANTGLQSDTCQSHAWNATHSGFKFCPDCGQLLARAAKTNRWADTLNRKQDL